MLLCIKGVAVVDGSHTAGTCRVRTLAQDASQRPSHTLRLLLQQYFTYLRSEGAETICAYGTYQVCSIVFSNTTRKEARITSRVSLGGQWGQTDAGAAA